MKVSYPSVLATILIVTSCAARLQPVGSSAETTPAAAPPDWDESAEELRVYQTIDEQRRGEVAEQVVNPKADTWMPEAGQLKTETRELFAPSAPAVGLDESASDNWLAKQSAGDLFVTRFASGRKGWTVVDPKTLDHLNSRDPVRFWKGFHKMFPGESAIVWWSRVGFSSDRRQALVYVSSRYGDLGAWSGWVLLIKKDGQWIVTHRVAVRMS